MHGEIDASLVPFVLVQLFCGIAGQMLLPPAVICVPLLMAGTGVGLDNLLTDDVDAVHTVVIFDLIVAFSVPAGSFGAAGPMVVSHLGGTTVVVVVAVVVVVDVVVVVVDVVVVVVVVVWA